MHFFFLSKKRQIQIYPLYDSTYMTFWKRKIYRDISLDARTQAIFSSSNQMPSAQKSQSPMVTPFFGLFDC